MLPIRRTELDSKTLFSFACRCCLQCCRAKKIQVNPFEIARLAGNLGISTTEFIDRYTIENGSFLKFDSNNSCIFLGGDGCMVHADRPLVCRLYPLGRHVNDSGAEWFSEIVPEDGCQGEFGSDGAIGDYLENQEAAVYMQAADSYLTLLWDMMSLLENGSAEDEISESLDTVSSEISVVIENGGWLDMDKAVDIWCHETQIPLPVDVDEKMRIHQNLLHLWINGKL
jgi:Fe-S-cluster containining protein